MLNKLINSVRNLDGEHPTLTLKKAPQISVCWLESNRGEKLAIRQPSAIAGHCGIYIHCRLPARASRSDYGLPNRVTT